LRNLLRTIARWMVAIDSPSSRVLWTLVANSRICSGRLLVVDLVDAQEKGDAGAAVIALLDSVAEAVSDIGLAVAIDVLQGHQESPGLRCVVVVIAAAPGVDVDN